MVGMNVERKLFGAYMSKEKLLNPQLEDWSQTFALEINDMNSIPESITENTLV